MTWDEILDDMEDRLLRADLVLAGHGPAPDPFELPADMGPIPAGLEGRARAVLHRTLRTERALEAARLRIVDRLAADGHSARLAPAYVDTRL